MVPVESAPAGVLWILPASDCTSWAVMEATRSFTAEASTPSDCSWLVTSARPRNCSTVLRSACDATEATWSVPIIPAFTNCTGDQTTSTINNRQSVLAQTDFMQSPPMGLNGTSLLCEPAYYPPAVKSRK